MDVASQRDGSDCSGKVAEEVGVVGLGLLNQQSLVVKTLLYLGDSDAKILRAGRRKWYSSLGSLCRRRISPNHMRSPSAAMDE
jgi:hypothetical protein